MFADSVAAACNPCECGASKTVGAGAGTGAGGKMGGLPIPAKTVDEQ